MLANRNFEKNFMPVALDVKGKQILLIGGGRIAHHKIISLQKYADTILVIAQEVCQQIKSLGIPFLEKKYEPTDLKDAFLVYACTNITELNQKIRDDAHQQGILVNVVDNPANCDFVSPAIYKKDYLSIAVSSNAQDVYESIQLRNRIKTFLEDDHS